MRVRISQKTDRSAFPLSPVCLDKISDMADGGYIGGRRTGPMDSGLSNGFEPFGKRPVTGLEPFGGIRP